MPDRDTANGDWPDPREEDIVYGDRRISRPDVSLPDWDVPDSAYRPVPIVWFTGALFVTMFALGLVAVVFASTSGWLTLVIAALAAIAIGDWTWRRGMKSAGTGWKVATVVMLAFQLAVLWLGVSHTL